MAPQKFGQLVVTPLTALIIFLVLVLWLFCARLNYLWWNRLFDNDPMWNDRDLMVLLGPLGTVCVVFIALMDAAFRIWDARTRKPPAP